MKIKKLITYLAVACATVVVTACGGGSSSSGSNSGGGQNNTTKPEIMGYYTNWSTYDANYRPGDIPKQVDTILYAFAQVGSCAPGSGATMKDPGKCLDMYGPDDNIVGPQLLFTGIQDYTLKSTDPWSDFYKYSATYDYDQATVFPTGLGNIAKALGTGKKVLLSIGGWSLSAPIQVAIDDQHREKFVQSIISFMHYAEKDAQRIGSDVYNHFDGVDIDWEPNGNLWTLPATDSNNVSLTVTDLQNYYKFLKRLKEVLTENHYPTLSIAMTANPSAIRDVDSKYVDGRFWGGIAGLGVKLNMMTYDYNAQAFAGDCKYTQFNSPLWQVDSNPCDSLNGSFNIDDSVRTLANAGVGKSNIGIGVPAYGRAYALNHISDVSAYNPYAMFNTNPANVTAINNIAIPSFEQVWTNLNILTGTNYGRGLENGGKSENTIWVSQGSAAAGQTIATAYSNNNPLYPLFITYTSHSDAQNVMAYAKSKGLRGVMVWELDQDVRPDSIGYDGQKLEWNKTSIVSGLATAPDQPIQPTPAPGPGPIPPVPTPTPVSNYNLEITNTGLSTGMTVTSISNGSVSAGTFGYMNPNSGSVFSNTTYVSVQAIQGANNLQVKFNTWQGDYTCPGSFNFTSNMHVMVNGDTHACAFAPE